MSYKIVFFDIDGTILQSDHTYTQSTIDAIGQLKDQGLEVFLATGRPLHEIKGLADELNITSMIGYNGAFASYNGQTILNEPIDKTIVQKTIEIAKRHHHEFVMYSDQHNYFSSEGPIVAEFRDFFQLQRNRIYSNHIPIHHILGITVFDVNPSETNLYEFDPSFHLSHVNIDRVPHAYDLIRNEVNKGVAVKKVLAHLGISKEQSIAFGDGLNDKEMLQAVGEGFAMGNANPELFSYAKHRTTTVEDSGIFNGLKQLRLVK